MSEGYSLFSIFDILKAILPWAEIIFAAAVAGSALAANKIADRAIFASVAADVRAIQASDLNATEKRKRIVALADAVFGSRKAGAAQIVAYAEAIGLPPAGGVKSGTGKAANRRETMNTESKVSENRFIVVLFAFVVVAGLAVYFLRPSLQADRLEPVTLAASKNLWTSVPIIAKTQGYFEEEGLDVEIEYVQAARFAMDAVLSGQVQFGTVVDINLAYVGLSGNEDVRLISTIVRANDSAIIARRDAGIDQPGDLVGKRLGVLGGTTSEIFADRFLLARGIDPAAVEAQSLQPVAMQTALVEQGVDAASIWQPFIYNITNALGASNVVTFQDPDAYTGYMNVATMAPWLEENPETTAAFLRAMDRALVFIEENPEQAQEILAQEIDLELPVVQAIWGEYEFSNRIAQEELLGVVANEAEWIIRTQDEIEGPAPDFERFLAPRGMLVESGE